MSEQIFVGRRKTSIARVIVKNGTGKITINDKDINDVFPKEINRNNILNPFIVTETLGNYDVRINVNGGGFTGQTQAIRLGIARALVNINPEFRYKLKEYGFLTRDPRMVERKKYGHPKARKRFQFSKR